MTIEIGAISSVASRWFGKEIPKTKEEVTDKGKYLAKAFWEYRAGVAGFAVGWMAGRGARAATASVLAATGAGLPTVVAVGAVGGFATEYVGQGIQNIKDNSDLDRSNSTHLQRFKRAGNNLFGRRDGSKLAKSVVKGGIGTVVGASLAIDIGALADSGLGHLVGEKVSGVGHLVGDKISEIWKTPRDILHSAAIAQTVDSPRVDFLTKPDILPPTDGHDYFIQDRPQLPIDTPATSENTAIIPLPGVDTPDGKVIPGSDLTGKADWIAFQVSAHDMFGDSKEFTIDGVTKTVYFDTPEAIARLDAFDGFDRLAYDELTTDSRFAPIWSANEANIASRAIERTIALNGFNPFHLPESGDQSTRIMEHWRDRKWIPYVFDKPEDFRGTIRF